MKAIFIISLVITSSYCYGQRQISFERKNSLREFSMPLPYPCILKLKSGRKITGVICGINDSIIFKTNFKTQFTSDDSIQIRKIQSDSFMTKKEKTRQSMCVMYKDSVSYDYESIKKIHFDMLYKGKGNLRAIVGLLIVSTSLIASSALFVEYPDFHSLYSQTVFSVLPFAVGYRIYRMITVKNIRTKKWTVTANY